MAIKSSSFGATTVTGDDAKAFLRQVAKGRTSRVLKADSESGLKMARQYARSGLVELKTSKSSST
jgi:hypothetical protein